MTSTLLFSLLVLLISPSISYFICSTTCQGQKRDVRIQTKHFPKSFSKNFQLGVNIQRDCLEYLTETIPTEYGSYYNSIQLRYIKTTETETSKKRRENLTTISVLLLKQLCQGDSCVERCFKETKHIKTTHCQKVWKVGKKVKNCQTFSHVKGVCKIQCKPGLLCQNTCKKVICGGKTLRSCSQVCPDTIKECRQVCEFKKIHDCIMEQLPGKHRQECRVVLRHISFKTCLKGCSIPKPTCLTQCNSLSLPPNLKECMNKIVQVKQCKKVTYQNQITCLLGQLDEKSQKQCEAVRFNPTIQSCLSHCYQPEVIQQECQDYLKVLIPKIKEKCQEKTVCCERKDACCQSIKTEHYRHLLIALSQRTRNLIRDISRRDESRLQLKPNQSRLFKKLEKMI